MVTASGSSLDPHIIAASAQAQAFRVAEARGASVDQVGRLMAQYTEAPALGFLGDARVNVLQLNLALDRHFPSAAGRLRGYNYIDEPRNSP